MARPILNQITHGQQSWDVDIQDNFDVFENQATLIPQYANFAALPAANLFERCLAATIAPPEVWFSDGTSWLATVIPGFALPDSENAIIAQRVFA